MKQNDVKIGIMGGTFNPIHMGHLVLAEQALQQAKLDLVLFMPSNNPPHKRNVTIVSDEHRIQMTSLAIKDNDFFELSTFEMEREGFTYTADTLTILKEQYPDKQFFFIIGADSFLQFENWYKPELIAEKCTLIVAGRDFVTKEELIRHKDILNEKLGVNCIFINMPEIGISSRVLRENFALEKSNRYLVPEQVLEYIKQHKLYENM